MRTTPLILLALGVLSVPLAAGDFEIRQIERTFDLEGRTALRLDLPVAELRVEGGKGSTVEVDLTATCKRDHDCKSVLAGIDFESHASRTTLRLDLVGYPKWGKGRVEVEAQVRVPRDLDIEIEMGVGELELKGLAGDLRVELGVGEVNAWLPRAALRSVTLDAGVGESELYGADERIAGRRSMLVGSEVHWDEGQGTKRAFLEVGVGEVSVWLE
jgi:hypothetical protein